MIMKNTLKHQVLLMIIGNENKKNYRKFMAEKWIDVTSSNLKGVYSPKSFCKFEH